MALFVVVAWGCLVYSFMVSDFSVLNVATNSNSQLPASTASRRPGLARGSMLLWVFMPRVLDAGGVAQEPPLPTTWWRSVLGVMGLVSFGFLLFMLLTSNPSTGCSRCRPTAATSIRCCRTRAW